MNDRSNDSVTGLLKSNAEICRYLGISEPTLVRWRKLHGFPASYLPDGRVVTTKSLIDQWVMARSDVAKREAMRVNPPAHLAGDGKQPPHWRTANNQ